MITITITIIPITRLTPIICPRSKLPQSAVPLVHLQWTTINTTINTTTTTVMVMVTVTVMVTDIDMM